MAPRNHTLPAANTESAREARRSFFCELCGKGYARSNEFEVHEGSYDHQHRKRMKEMKAMTKDPNASAKREAERRAEENASGMRKITLAAPMPRKAAVFKKVQDVAVASARDGGSKSGEDDEDGDKDVKMRGGDSEDVDVMARNAVDSKDDPTQAKANGWYEDRYRPDMITTCEDFCADACCREKAYVLVGENSSARGQGLRRDDERLGRPGGRVSGAFS